MRFSEHDQTPGNMQSRLLDSSNALFFPFQLSIAPVEHPISILQFFSTPSSWWENTREYNHFMESLFPYSFKFDRSSAARKRPLPPGYTWQRAGSFSSTTTTMKPHLLPPSLEPSSQKLSRYLGVTRSMVALGDYWLQRHFPDDWLRIEKFATNADWALLPLTAHRDSWLHTGKENPIYQSSSVPPLFFVPLQASHYALGTFQNQDHFFYINDPGIVYNMHDWPSLPINMYCYEYIVNNSVSQDPGFDMYDCLGPILIYVGIHKISRGMQQFAASFPSDGGKYRFSYDQRSSQELFSSMYLNFCNQACFRDQKKPCFARFLQCFSQAQTGGLSKVGKFLPPPSSPLPLSFSHKCEGAIEIYKRLSRIGTVREFRTTFHLTERRQVNLLADAYLKHVLTIANTTKRSKIVFRLNNWMMARPSRQLVVDLGRRSGNKIFALLSKLPNFEFHDDDLDILLTQRQGIYDNLSFTARLLFETSSNAVADFTSTMHSRFVKPYVDAASDYRGAASLLSTVNTALNGILDKLRTLYNWAYAQVKSFIDVIRGAFTEFNGAVVRFCYNDDFWIGICKAFAVLLLIKMTAAAIYWTVELVSVFENFLTVTIPGALTAPFTRLFAFFNDMWKKPDPDTVTKQGLFDLRFGDIVSAITGCFTYLGKPFQPGGWGKAIPMFKSLADSLKWFFDNGQDFITSVSCWWVGCETPADATASEMISQINLCKSLKSIYTASGTVTASISSHPDFLREVRLVESMDIALLPRRTKKSHKITPSLTTAYTDALREVKPIISAVTRYTSHEDPRPIAFWAHFYGGSGTGKSLSVAAQFGAIKKQLFLATGDEIYAGEFNWKRDVYTYNQKDEYHDSYLGQPFLYVDDLFQVSNVEMRAQTALLLLNLIGPQPYNPLVADPSKKELNMTFRIAFILTTGNEFSWDNTGIEHYEALSNRVALFVDVGTSPDGFVTYRGGQPGTPHSAQRSRIYTDANALNRYGKRDLTLRNTNGFHDLSDLAAVMVHAYLAPRKTKLIPTQVVPCPSYFLQGPRLTVGYQENSPDVKIIENTNVLAETPFPVKIHVRPLPADDKVEVQGMEDEPDSTPSILPEPSAEPVSAAAQRIDQSFIPLDEIEAHTELLTIRSTADNAFTLGRRLFDINQRDATAMYNDEQRETFERIFNVLNTSAANANVYLLFSAISPYQIGSTDADTASSVFAIFKKLVDSAKRSPQNCLLHDIRAFAQSMDGRWWIRVIEQNLTARSTKARVSTYFKMFRDPYTPADIWWENPLRGYERYKARKTALGPPSGTWECSSPMFIICDYETFLHFRRFALASHVAAAVVAAGAVIVIGAAIVKSAGSVYRSLFNKDIDTQSGAFKGDRPTGPRIHAPRIGVAQVVSALPHAQSNDLPLPPETVLNPVPHLICRNIVSANFNGLSGYVLGVMNGLFITPTHLLAQMKSGTNIHLSPDGNGVGTVINWADCVHITLGELSAISVRSSISFRDITKHFSDGVVENVPILRIRPTVEQNVLSFYRHETNIWTYNPKPLAYWQGCEGEFINMPNSNGHCGLPYLYANTQQGTKICFIHGAGNPTRKISYGHAITRAMVETIVELHKQHGGIQVTTVERFDGSSPSFPVLQAGSSFSHNTTLIGQFPPGISIPAPTKTSKVKTELHPKHDSFPLQDRFGPLDLEFMPTRSPVDLSPSGPGGGMNFAFNKYSVVSGQLNIAYVLDPKLSDGLTMHELVPPGFDTRGTEQLTLEEAIHGAEGIESLDLKPSTGYPSSLHHVTRVAYLFNRKGELKHDVVKEIAELLTMLKHAVVPMVSIVRPKDELIDNDSIAKGKVRTISMGELKYIIVGKMIFARPLKKLHSQPAHSACATGLNPHGPDATVLYHRLRSISTLALAGDFSGHEFTLPFEFVEEYIVWWDEVLPLHPVLQQQRANYIRSVLQSLLAAFRRVWYFGRGQSSGNDLTQHYASWCTHRIHKLCWRSVGYDYKDWDGNVAGTTLGDDCLYVVTALFPRFNMINLRTFASSIGMVYTTPTKGEVSLPYLDLNEIEFLKRMFVMLNGKMCMRLRYSSIIESLMYESKDATHADRTNTIANALTELRYYGPVTYDRVRFILSRFMASRGFYTPMDSFATSWSKFADAL